MSTTQIDAMIRKTLREMIEYGGLEETPESISAFAQNKLDFPVTLEQTKAALVRTLVKKISAYPIEEDEEAVEDVQSFLGVTSLQSIPWASYGYETLEKVHAILRYNNAPNLLHE